jgi:hypothetical protein
VGRAPPPFPGLARPSRSTRLHDTLTLHLEGCPGRKEPGQIQSEERSSPCSPGFRKRPEECVSGRSVGEPRSVVGCQVNPSSCNQPCRRPARCPLASPLSTSQRSGGRPGVDSEPCARARQRKQIRLGDRFQAIRRKPGHPVSAMPRVPGSPIRRPLGLRVRSPRAHCPTRSCGRGRGCPIGRPDPSTATSRASSGAGRPKRRTWIEGRHRTAKEEETASCRTACCGSPRGPSRGSEEGTAAANNLCRRPSSLERWRRRQGGGRNGGPSTGLPDADVEPPR